MFFDGLNFSLQILEVLFQCRDAFRARCKAAFEFAAALARVFLALATAARMSVVPAAVTFTFARVLVTFAITLAVMSAVPVAMTVALAAAMLFVTVTHFFISFEKICRGNYKVGNHAGCPYITRLNK